MKKTSLKLKKAATLTLIAIAFCLTNPTEIKAQKPNEFSVSLDFKRYEEKVGHYPGFGNYWIAKEPYNILLKGRLEESAQYNQYSVKLAVYIERTPFIDCLLEYGMETEECRRVAKGINNSIYNRYRSESPVRGERSCDKSIGTEGWEECYIEIAHAETECIVKKSNEEMPPCLLDMLTHEVKFDGKNFTVVDEYGQDYWLNCRAGAVAMAEIVGKPGEYIVIDVKTQDMGNLYFDTLEASTIKYTPSHPKVELNYYVTCPVPADAYGIMSSDDNAFCLWDYSYEDFNSVYYAIQAGGYDAGFEHFKKTVMFYDYNEANPTQRRCQDNDIIGFVKLNKKNPQGEWVGFPGGWSIDPKELSTVTLGDENGPWRIPGTNQTIAKGGWFSFSEFVISNDPKVKKTLPNGTVPGIFAGMAIHIEPCEGEGCSDAPEVSIAANNVEDIIEFYGNAIVINETGKGVFRIYDIQGRLLHESSVSGKTSIDLRPYQQNRAMYIINYTNDGGSFSKKVGNN